MDIIQQLKDNERPFGLMSEEMRYAIREIPIKYLQVYEIGHWLDLTQPLDRTQDVLRYTYRLRPDYEDEPEIVECEIYTVTAIEGFHTEVYDFGGEHEIGLALIPDGYKRVGFKFLDGTVFGLPVSYSVPGITSHGYYASYEDIKTKQALEHHAVSVLFRRKKQENK